MPKCPITDYIFDQKEMKHLFNMNDEELKSLENKMSKADDKMYEFIEKRVHSRSRKKLREIIEHNIDCLIAYYDRQEHIYYKSGFYDGVRLFNEIFSSKV